MNQARKHHYIPQFLLKPWTIEKKLHAYYWNEKTNSIQCINTKGTKYYCNEKDLFSLEETSPYRTDALETDFMGEIDQNGSKAKEILIENVNKLTEEQRCDWVRLLFSLTIRQPETVKKFTEEGKEQIARSLSSDETKKKLLAQGINVLPSNWFENYEGVSLRNRALLTIQKAIDDPIYGKKLLNAYWHVHKLENSTNPLILCDRPFYSAYGFDNPNNIWALPLAPDTAFIATNRVEVMEKIIKTSHIRFSKQLNISMAIQTKKYVFSTTCSHAKWLEKYLKK